MLTSIFKNFTTCNYLQYAACSPPLSGFFLVIYFGICNSFFHVILIDSSFQTCSLTLIYLSLMNFFSYFWICFLKYSLILKPLFFLSQICLHLGLMKTFGLFLLSPHSNLVNCSCFSLVTLMMPVTIQWNEILDWVKCHAANEKEWLVWHLYFKWGTFNCSNTRNNQKLKSTERQFRFVKKTKCKLFR